MMTSLSFMHRARAATDKPNILMIIGDDVGQTDISAYRAGVMGNRL
jgi:arylsulfatase A-like enzyme